MINKLLKVIFLTGLFVAMFYSNSLAVIIIELKENVSLSGEEIFLKDIANLNNASVDNVYIGKMPLPGRKRYITQDYVKLRVLQAKIKEGNFKLTGANEVEITASSQLLDIEELIKIARNHLLDKIKINQRLIIEPLGVPESIILPVGKVDFEIDSINNPNLERQVYLPVNVKINGIKYRTVKIGFKIHRFASVVLAAKPLPRYYVLTPLDVEIQEREVTDISPVALDDVIGKRLKNSVRGGEILTYDLIEIPPLINRGDVVTIKRESEFLIIKTKGVAKKDGRLGEKIQVENIDSKKMISGIVEDDKTVVVK